MIMCLSKYMGSVCQRDIGHEDNPSTHPYAMRDRDICRDFTREVWWFTPGTRRIVVKE
jgi:hypothetical protein